MKKQLSKNAFWQTLLSTGVLGIFLVLAAGSTLQLGWIIDAYERGITRTEPLEDGRKKQLCVSMKMQIE